MPLRRTIKNVVRNYSDAQVKVREATSNDPWGPASTLMTEIADLTYNVLAFTEIMRMIWKRLNDHGRNWRHVYKSLVLLEYLIKTGSEKVAHQCRENIITIQTLREFQYVEDAKDYGQNVREKAKQLTNLLMDSERLKNERVKALKAKEKFAQTTSGVRTSPNFASTSPGLSSILSYPEKTVGRYTGFNSPSSWSLEGGHLDVELEAVRPTSSGEEQLQLELAIAMSKEEHEQQMELLKGDEVKLQMALQQSKLESQRQNGAKGSPAKQGNDFDALFGPSDPWACLAGPSQNHDDQSPWKQISSSKDNGRKNSKDFPNKESSPLSEKSLFQPFGQDNLNDEFDQIGARIRSKELEKLETDISPGQSTLLPPSTSLFTPTTSSISENQQLNNQSNFNSSKLDDSVSNLTLGNKSKTTLTSEGNKRQTRGKSPKDFLGENASLVNLDNLMSQEKPTTNPFSSTMGRPSPITTLNPFFSSPLPSQHYGQTLPSSFHLLNQNTTSFDEFNHNQIFHNVYNTNVSSQLFSTSSSSPITTQLVSIATTTQQANPQNTNSNEMTSLPSNYPPQFNPFL